MEVIGKYLPVPAAESCPSSDKTRSAGMSSLDWRAEINCVTRLSWAGVGVVRSKLPITQIVMQAGSISLAAGWGTAGSCLSQRGEYWISPSPQPAPLPMMK